MPSVKLSIYERLAIEGEIIQSCLPKQVDYVNRKIIQALREKVKINHQQHQFSHDGATITWQEAEEEFELTEKEYEVLRKGLQENSLPSNDPGDRYLQFYERIVGPTLPEDYNQ